MVTQTLVHALLATQRLTFRNAPWVADVASSTKAVCILLGPRFDACLVPVEDWKTYKSPGGSLCVSFKPPPVAHSLGGNGPAHRFSLPVRAPVRSPGQTQLFNFRCSETLQTTSKTLEASYTTKHAGAKQNPQGMYEKANPQRRRD